ncbi:MAG: SDR family oxidoreductase [Pseudomonadota bacterium]
MSRVAIITGAASGIGRSTAERLIGQDWSVVGLDVSYSGELTSSDQTDGLKTLHCDVTNQDSIAEAFDAIANAYGHVDAVVCSAGKLEIGPLSDMPVEDFDRLYQVNTRGAWLCARQAIPLMRKSPYRDKFPRIVFLGSIAGIRPKVSGGAYGAQKAALHVITSVMAAELGPEGILVNAVAPGTVDTPMVQAKSDSSKTGDYRPSGNSPLGRVAAPEDIAAVIEFLLGEQANYVTGAIIPADGGTRAAFIPPAVQA